MWLADVAYVKRRLRQYDFSMYDGFPQIAFFIRGYEGIIAFDETIKRSSYVRLILAWNNNSVSLSV